LNNFGRHDLTCDRVRHVVMEFCCIYCYKNIKYRYSAHNPVQTNCILEVCTVLHVYWQLNIHCKSLSICKIKHHAMRMYWGAVV
jgi:hypothetical protein